MRILKKDWFSYYGKPDFFCLWTGNLSVTSNGYAVMGRGLAKQVSLKFPSSKKELGELMGSHIVRTAKDKNGHMVYIANSDIYAISPFLGMFPVKYGWWEKADIDLIAASSKELNRIAMDRPFMTFVVNFPGIGAGGLEDKEVRPIIKKHMTAPNIIVVWQGEKEAPKKETSKKETKEMPAPKKTEMKKMAIIGPRNIKSQKAIEANIRKYLADNKLKYDIVVSGNAEGTDQIANSFASDHIVAHYLPWGIYNQELRKEGIRYITHPTEMFDDQILELFPFMKDKGQGVWKLVRRNFQIILGKEGEYPVDVVFYHSETKEVSGGTRYGYVIAKAHGIKTVRV
ncbi:MAG: hypothetical protein EOM21_17740 [Gammaproteobacteria bacterium]|nr:hypothetical protein [Gammaproteobacteria bacterium]